MTLQDKTWLTKDDIVSVRELSQNIESSKIDAYIIESQFEFIRPFLGDELYSAMQDDWDDVLKTFNTATYNDLWFGTVYDGIRFNGLILAATYETYARFLLQQQVNVSRFGVESIQNEISEDVTNATIRSKANDARKIGIAYRNKAHDYLCANSSNYPLYENYKTVNAPTTGFGFFKL